ncbi:hypothetical protein [Comamonas fluminis]|uniref:hypothetical protein n=1 Tax=Comamonas fluminis TaxID=2796366 RepID=UPI001FE4C0C4|nr:hypothetical protein [Comamonas fluminis]
MKIKYSAETGGFYFSNFHYDIPRDAVELSEAAYKGLLHSQSSGMMIKPDSNGYPIAVEKDVGPVVAPLFCTPAQGLVALYALKSITEETILTAIESIPDDVQRYTARIGYQRATSWERNSPTMQTMAQLLQLTDADLDELFSYAASVNV